MFQWAKAMESRRSVPEREDWPGTVRDHKFLELCALAIAGELTDEEQKSLEAHLVECADCRQALKEFGAAADIGVPLLHSHLSCRAPGVEDLPLTPEVKPTESH